MISVTVPEKYHQKKLDRFLTEYFKKLPRSAVFKALRNKDIRVNGKKIIENISVQAGDVLDVYIKDDVLYGADRGTVLLSADRQKNRPPVYNIIYEDQNLLMVNKKPGIPVDNASDANEASLIDMVTLYLQEKGEYIPGKTDHFAPALCHRLDRNTGGIVIIAKTQEALDIMLDKIKNHEVKKFYQCIVMGCPQPLHTELRHYLFKDSRKSQVYISEIKKPGYVEIITRYKVLETGEEMSRLEVELVTGRTHQIRAHLAYIGHPIVGDGKYGVNKFNRKVGAKNQALWAYKVVFDFTDGGVLNYLKGSVFETNDIEFQIAMNRS